MEKTIFCKDCGKPFTFDEGEQKYYKKHLLEEPKRCKACRKERKLNFEIDSCFYQTRAFKKGRPKVRYYPYMYYGYDS